MNPLPNGEMNWNMTCVRIKSSPESLPCDVERVKREFAVDQSPQREEQHQQLERHNCTIFTMNDVRLNAHQVEKNLRLYRHLFERNDKNTTRQSVIHRKETTSKAAKDVINIAIHIRRGDLFQFVSKSTKRRDKFDGKFQATLDSFQFRLIHLFWSSWWQSYWLTVEMTWSEWFKWLCIARVWSVTHQFPMWWNNDWFAARNVWSSW